jgi:hypothetical protein
VGGEGELMDRQEWVTMTVAFCKYAVRFIIIVAIAIFLLVALGHLQWVR